MFEFVKFAKFDATTTLSIVGLQWLARLIIEMVHFIYV